MNCILSGGSSLHLAGPAKPMISFRRLSHILRRGAFVLLAAAMSAPLLAQDLIARQAPVDRRLRAVDSVAIQRAVERDLQLDYSSEVYKSWITTRAHPYEKEEVPDSFRIDLRGFTMPTASRIVTSRYGYRPAFRRMHKGLDIKVYTGDTIVAAFDGKVRVVRYDGGGYGNYIVVRHHNGLETIYGHLSKQLVEVDEEVKSGQPIGLGGNTGRSFGSHLHFETRLAGEPINPELLFNFPEQDVTADYYTFHKQRPSSPEPVLAANTAVAEQSQAPVKSTHYYKVVKGDTLYSIAGKLGLSVSQLVKTNRLKTSSKLRLGQILRY